MIPEETGWREGRDRMQETGWKKYGGRIETGWRHVDRFETG